MAEEIATEALAAQKTGGAFDLATLLRTTVLTETQDMPDEARAKFYLATGRATLVGISAKILGQLEAGIERLKHPPEPTYD